MTEYVFLWAQVVRRLTVQLSLRQNLTGLVMLKTFNARLTFWWHRSLKSQKTRFKPISLINPYNLVPAGNTVPSLLSSLSLELRRTTQMSVHSILVVYNAQLFQIRTCLYISRLSRPNRRVGWRSKVSLQIHVIVDSSTEVALDSPQRFGRSNGQWRNDD